MLERTIHQLDIGHVPPDQAEHLGHLGYIQWLGSLKGDASYPAEAMRAYALAQPFLRTSPAVAVFCHLLVASVTEPLVPLPLKLSGGARRGGSQARRMLL